MSARTLTIFLVLATLGFGAMAQDATESFRNLTAVTSDSKIFHYDLDVSPDGKLILYTSNHTDPNGDIHVQALSGRSFIQRTFFSGFDRFGRFSPNGQQIAFSSDRNGNFDIFIMNTNSGTAIRQLTTNPTDDILPSWSPDGDKIVYTALSLRSSTIWIVGLKAGSFTIIGDGQFASFSPDGTKLVYVKEKKGGGLWVIDINGNNDTQVLPGKDWDITWPSWSPDGKQLLFSSAGSARRIAASGIKSRGGKLARAYRKTDLWVVDLNGTNLNQISTSKRADWNARWSPDGKVYFVSDRDLGESGRRRTTKATNIWSFELALVGSE